MHMEYLRNYFYKNPPYYEVFRAPKTFSNFILPRIRKIIFDFNEGPYFPHELVKEIEKNGYNPKDFDKIKIWKAMLKKMERAFFLLSDENKKGFRCDDEEIIKDGLF